MMAVTDLPIGKDLRRIIHCEHKNGHIPFDITLSDKGLTIRRADTTNRRFLFIPWHIAMQNSNDPKKGYRIWSLEQAFSYLGDTTAHPELCPLCGQKETR